ncbi:Amino acid/polyamine transporter 2 [Dillenia turbinata]|uniref:Amino acid/polyamine transporter 2 n=1 Tax=Dillenia turbinata TaxID=194707 RepID=A0AAN8VKU0_9MAGN
MIRLCWIIYLFIHLLQMGNCKLVYTSFGWHMLHWKTFQRTELEILAAESENCGVGMILSLLGKREEVSQQFVASMLDLLCLILSFSQRFIGAVNGVLVFGIIISFAALVAVASGDVQWNALLEANFEAAPSSIPIIALSFVYQNVVPVLCTNLEGDMSKVRTAIVLGTAIPLGLFLVWNAVILGTIPNLEAGLDKTVDPLQELRSANGSVGPIVEVFSLLAIATSYIGFVLGLSDFLADLLKLPAGQSMPLPYILTLIPPLILSLLDPEIFFKALDFAGTYGVLVLFGILPAAMSWSDRYSSSSDFPKLPELVPGGRVTLSLVIGGAGCVILSELVESFSAR